MKYSNPEVAQILERKASIWSFFWRICSDIESSHVACNIVQLYILRLNNFARGIFNNKIMIINGILTKSTCSHPSGLYATTTKLFPLGISASVGGQKLILSSWHLLRNRWILCSWVWRRWRWGLCTIVEQKEQNKKSKISQYTGTNLNK